MNNCRRFTVPAFSGDGLCVNPVAFYKPAADIIDFGLDWSDYFGMHSIGLPVVSSVWDIADGSPMSSVTLSASQFSDALRQSIILVAGGAVEDEIHLQNTIVTAAVPAEATPNGVGFPERTIVRKVLLMITGEFLC